MAQDNPVPDEEHVDVEELEVADVMGEEPVLCPPDMTIEEAARRMRDQEVGELVVVESVESGVPVGVIADHDIVARLVAEGKDPREVRVSDLMAKGLTSIREDARIPHVVDAVCEDMLHGAVVVDAEGRVVGTLTVVDLAMAGIPLEEVDEEEGAPGGAQGAPERRGSHGDEPEITTP